MSNPTGGVSLGTQNTATLTILDDNTTNPPTVNPIDNMNQRGLQYLSRRMLRTDK
ncbi:MAG: hypothetical protein M3Q91_16560 [Acidobacteriota bacterium]|nr:hypothetical protein [Acidobacteriota bacterium]